MFLTAFFHSLLKWNIKYTSCEQFKAERLFHEQKKNDLNGDDPYAVYIRRSVYAFLAHIHTYDHVPLTVTIDPCYTSFFIMYRFLWWWASIAEEMPASSHRKMIWWSFKSFGIKNKSLNCTKLNYCLHDDRQIPILIDWTHTFCSFMHVQCFFLFICSVDTSFAWNCNAQQINATK